MIKNLSKNFENITNFTRKKYQKINELDNQSGIHQKMNKPLNFKKFKVLIQAKGLNPMKTNKKTNFQNFIEDKVEKKENSKIFDKHMLKDYFSLDLKNIKNFNLDTDLILDLKKKKKLKKN